MKVITICGSRRNKVLIEQINRKLALEGNIVFAPTPIMEHCLLSNEQYNTLKEVHKNKISKSDAVFIINPNGHIGDDVMEELEYAKAGNKEVMYLE